jgi:hypothetical protein
MSAAVARVRRSLGRHGFAGTARLAAARAGGLAYLREHHLWYELDLGGERPRRELADGLALGRAGKGELARLEELPSILASEAATRLAQGVEWWLVRDGDVLAFSCWVFHDGAPVLAARGGKLALPERTSFPRTP